MSRIKVCHVTSAHNQFDDRIYLKECQSLAKAGYDVFLLSRDSELKKEGITFIQCGENKPSRIMRILKSANEFFNSAIALDCNIYHFHDPELLPCALKLKKKGKIVIFDSHEDVPAQILDKHWIPSLFRRMVSSIYRKYESYVVKRLDGVVAATPFIAEKFEHRAKQIVTINNYPIIGDINFSSKSFYERDAKVCYVGGLSDSRGLSVMIGAIQDIPMKLILAGNYQEPEVLNSKHNVEYMGWVDREKLDTLYSQTIGGLLVLQPTKNYYTSQPIKMYEYMAAGLPIVASNFPYWKEIIENNECGICINPESVSELKQAVLFLNENRDKAQEMGRRGYELVTTQYNWGLEEQKLLGLYSDFHSKRTGV